MSSAILYLAIVAIWAVVLVPRWLRYSHTAAPPAAADSQAGEYAAEAPTAFSSDTEAAGGQTSRTAPAAATAAGGAPRVSRPQHPRAGPAAGTPVPASPSPAERRARIVRARRRLLSALVLLSIGAVALAAAHLAAWWVTVPPILLLGGFLLLLREAARIDAERAAYRLRAARDAQAAERAEDGPDRDSASPAPAAPGLERDTVAEAASPGAEIIDISARITDQLYDQYTDAEARAIGD